MLHNDLEALKAITDQEIDKLPTSYDDFAVGIISVADQLYIVYDSEAIINDLIENIGLDAEQAQINFAETIGNNPNVAFFVTEIRQNNE